MHNAKRLLLLVVLLLLSAQTLLLAQEVSEKRDIAIFKLSYYDWSIPNEVLGSVDSEIRAVFVNLGRFNVMGMTYRLGSDNVSEFIKKIKEFKEKRVKIPEEVAMGHEIFSEADLEELISSFIVVIPAVTYFNLRVDRDDEQLFKGYDVEMKTSFSILNVDSMVLEKEIVIETSGYDKDRESAIQAAITDITSKLEFEIKSVPIFTLKTGVLEVYPRGVTLQMGSDMGIKKGYEFVVLTEQVLKSGHKRSRETALVLVNRVDQEVSEATILYGDPQEGDQLKEVPRIGVDATVYAHPLISFSLDDMPIIAVGVRATSALGFYSMRPLFGVEMHFNSSTDESEMTTARHIWQQGIPFTPYLGIEYTSYLGRLQFSPAAGVGASFIYYNDDYEGTETVGITHIGGKAYMQVSYLVNRDLKIALDAGAALWISLDSTQYNSFTGILGGLSVIWKG